MQGYSQYKPRRTANKLLMGTNVHHSHHSRVKMKRMKVFSFHHEITTMNLLQLITSALR